MDTSPIPAARRTTFPSGAAEVTKPQAAVEFCHWALLFSEEFGDVEKY